MARRERNSTFGIWSFLPAVVPHRSAFAEVYIASLALHVLALATPLFFQAIIDRALVYQATSTLAVLAAGVLLVMLFEAAFSLTHSYILSYVHPKIDMPITARIFRHVVSLPITYFEGQRAGSLIQDMQQDQTVRNFLTQRLFTSLTELTALVVFLPILLVYSPMLTGIVLVSSLAIAILTAALSRHFRVRMSNLYSASCERQAHLVETIHGILTVKSLGLEDRQQRTWEETSAEWTERGREFYWLSCKAGVATSMIDKLMTVGIITCGAFLVFRGHLSLGQLVAFQMLSARVSGPLIQLISLIQAYQEAIVSARALGGVIEAEPESNDGQDTPQIDGRISFEGVTFSYDENRRPALKDVSFSIPDGSVLGVVGRSGSGKSTLIKLVQGLLEPQAGTVRLDETRLPAFNRRYLRSQIGVVPQDVFLFRGTVFDNIVAGLEGVTEAGALEAAQLAGADEFIFRLPNGLQTELGEGAAALSGGQRQRLAIARALLRKPKILVLDEATSALDLESEAIIHDNLAGIINNQTTIIVTHRVASLRLADNVLVLDEGRVAGFGHHDELMRFCEIYRHLWSYQGQLPMQMAAE